MAARLDIEGSLVRDKSIVCIAITKVSQEMPQSQKDSRPTYGTTRTRHLTKTDASQLKQINQLYQLPLILTAVLRVA